MTPGPLRFSSESMLSSGGHTCTKHLMVGSPTCCRWGPRPSRPPRLWCQPSPSRRAGRSGSSQTRLRNQERHHLHLLDGVVGSQSDAALRVGVAAIIGLVQRLAGPSAADCRWRQCRRTWLANSAGVSAANRRWRQCRRTWAASTWSCTGRHNNQRPRQGTSLCCCWTRGCSLRRETPGKARHH